MWRVWRVGGNSCRIPLRRVPLLADADDDDEAAAPPRLGFASMVKRRSSLLILGVNYFGRTFPVLSSSNPPSPPCIHPDTYHQPYPPVLDPLEHHLPLPCVSIIYLGLVLRH
ncbi:hypothetical protein KCU71_g121, partial [Aureobasidium melanogenum]